MKHQECLCWQGSPSSPGFTWREIFLLSPLSFPALIEASEPWKFTIFLKKQSSIYKSKQMLDPELSCEEAQLYCNLANLISEELYFLP